MPRVRHVLVTFVLILGTLAAQGAHADPAADAQARAAAKAKFEEASAAIARGNHAEAERLLKASLALAGNPAAAYNLSTTLEAQGRYVESIAVLEELARGRWGAVSAERERDLRERTTALRAKLGHLTVVIDGPPTAALTIPGFAAPILTENGVVTRDVDPGTWVIEVSADGHVPVKERVVVTAGAPTRVEVRLEPTPGRLTLASEPPGELVTIVGVGTFRSPVTRSLAPRAYEVQLGEDRATRRRVSVGAGEAVEFTLSRDGGGGEDSDNTALWLVGGGVVLAAAAAVVTVVLLSSGTTERPVKADPVFGVTEALR